MEDGRELLFGNRRPVGIVYQLREKAFGVAALTRLRQVLYRAAADRGVLDARNQHLSLDSEVPQLQDLHSAELGHMLAVGSDTSEHCILGIGFRQSVVAAGNHEARRETLEVSLPGRGKGLIEVVDGEDDLPLRRCETPKVDQVRVSTTLHADTSRRRAGQVVRHGERRTAVEGEGRQHHAPVAKRRRSGRRPSSAFNTRRTDPAGRALASIQRAGLADNCLATLCPSSCVRLASGVPKGTGACDWRAAGIPLP